MKIGRGTVKMINSGGMNRRVSSRERKREGCPPAGDEAAKRARRELLEKPSPLGRFPPHRSEPATVVIPALSRNLFSSADGIDHAPSFPPRGYRVPALRGGEAVAAPPGEKSEWIPASAGMTIKIVPLAMMEKYRSGQAPVPVRGLRACPCDARPSRGC